MIQLAVLLPALALSAATSPAQAATPALVAAVAAEDAGSVQNVQEATGTAEEPGFMEKYFPFTFTPEQAREPETNDNFIILYLSGFLTTMLLANVWLPIVAIGNPDGFIMDQIIGTALHYIPFVICPPVFFIMLWANALYLMPVQTVNAFDRNLKAAKRAGTWQGKSADLSPKGPEVDNLAMAY
jgi:hypothetical protein